MMKYKVTNNFNGRMKISSTYFNEKPKGNEIAKIHFNEMTVSNDMLSSFITNGYCYCPTDRKLDNVKESDYICIDVDDSTVEMNDYVSTLTDKPTIYYTTPSNGNIEKSQKKFGDDKHIYRFRLLYALDTPTTNATEYEQAYRYIVDKNNMSYVDALPANQYYNGSKDCEMHNTQRVYSLPDEYKDVDLGKEEKKAPNPKSKKTPDNFASGKGNHGTTLDEDVRSAFLNCTKYEDFLEWYYGEFGGSNLLRETPYLQDETDERILVCGNDYYVIPKKYIRWDNENKTKIYGRWIDGDNRHTKIYITGIILRKLNPTATANDLLREIVAILLTYYDICNPGGELKFNKKTILQLLDSVMKADLTKEMKALNHSSFKVSNHYCDKNRVSKRTVVSEILSERRMEKKEEKYSEIDYFYNPNLSWDNGSRITQGQWLVILQENGIEVSIATFKRYLKDRGFSKRRKKESIITKPNITTQLSIRFSDDTFPEEVVDDTSLSSDRMFREIVSSIHSTDEFRRRWKV